MMNTASNLRPRNVVIAVAILCVVQMYDLVSVLSHVEQLVLIRRSSTNDVYATVLVGVCVSLFFIYKIFERRNWARIAYLVLFLLGVLAEVSGVITLFHQRSIWTPLDIFSSIAEIVVLILLFTGLGNSWFKRVVV